MKSAGCIFAVKGVSKFVLTPPDRATDVLPALVASEQRTALLRKAHIGFQGLI